MNYRKDKYNNELSVLGFGCMRFKRNLGKTDFALAEKLVLNAINCGVNYFDTAYIYPGNEAVLGEILSKNNLRKKVYIATKFPHYLINSIKMLDKIFNEELKRLKTDYIDYYFVHMLTDVAAWERLCELGVKDWIAQKLKSGQIKQIGFSYHGNSDMFKKIIDAYPWDFTMIQYNYMDVNSQAGVKGLKYANEKGLPVMIMEPLRGGKLVNALPKVAKEIFANYSVKHTPAEWAFKWLYSQPQVTVVLSGMNSEQMVLENVKTASETNVGELSKEDNQMLDMVAKEINANMKVGCTGCGYCVPCPKCVDIPGVFSAYNRRYSENKFRALKEYFMCTTLRQNSTSASNCIGCGKCEKHCPQGINIRKELENAKNELEGPIYKIARKIAKVFVKF